jgi:hypothetical protein
MEMLKNVLVYSLDDMMFCNELMVNDALVIKEHLQHHLPFLVCRKCYLPE